MKLQNGLGKYTPRENKYLSKNGLTLHDLGELIRRMGRDKDFIVESEFKVFKDKVTGKWKRLDWVWFKQEDRNQPVVAFEIEGRDVKKTSIETNVKKFTYCRKIAPGCICVIALFQVDHNHEPKRKATRREKLAEYLKDFRAEIFMDNELMADGIEKFQDRVFNKIRR